MKKKGTILLLKFAKNFIISLIVSLFVVYSQDYPVQPAQQSILAYIVHLIILYLLGDMYKKYLEGEGYNTSILLIFFCVSVATILSIILIPLITGMTYSNGYNALNFIKTIEQNLTILNIGMYCYDNYFIELK